MGTLTSEAGVQQGDPLGPFYFALVLHHLVLSISKDESCQDLLFNAWYLDDGVMAGPSTSVQHVVCLLQDLGPSLGLHLNPSKCVHFGQGDLSVFPSQMNKSCTPNLIILGAPIGEVAFCSSFIASKRAAASILLSSLVKLGSCDPQIALILLRMCGGFTKLVHVARSTPPSLALDELHIFDEQVRCTFTECQAIDTTDSSWMQAQLSLSRGALGLRSLAHHSIMQPLSPPSVLQALPHHQIISWPMRSIPTTGVFPLRVQSILTVLLLLLADNTLYQLH